jgi:hypothetical protein
MPEKVIEKVNNDVLFELVNDVDYGDNCHDTYLSGDRSLG